MNCSPAASTARTSNRSHNVASLGRGKASSGSVASFGVRGLSGYWCAATSASRQRELSASSQLLGSAVARGDATYNYASERSSLRVSRYALAPRAAQGGR